WEAEHEEEIAEADDHGHLWEELSTGCGGEALCIARNLQEARDGWDRLSHRLSEADTSERENWLRVLANLDSVKSRDLVAELAAVETEPLVRLGAAQLLVEEGDRRAVAIALQLLAPAVPPMVRDESYQLIARQAGEDFGFDPFGSEEANAEAIERIQAWAKRP
ncbi:MAG: hypothetical protein WBO71_13840, partial [Thermoanaerobaculia bacterium]